MSKLNLAKIMIVMALIVAFTMAASPADASFLDRLKGVSSALTGEVRAVRAWVTVDPIIDEDSGGFELIAISIAGADPSKPAMLVRFERSDGPYVGKKIRAGVLLTILHWETETGGALPVLLVSPFKRGGWRAKNIRRASNTFAEWGYLIAGTAAAAGDGSLYEKFFENRESDRSLFENKVRQVHAVAFGEPEVEEKVVPVEILTFEIEFKNCQETLRFCQDNSLFMTTKIEDLGKNLAGCNKYAERAVKTFEWIIDSPAGNGHHPKLNERTNEMLPDSIDGDNMGELP